MLERYLTRMGTDDPGAQEPAAIRSRLRGVFSPGFERRATVFGLLMGGVLRSVMDGGCDTIVLASAFGEALALEAFLDTFPHPSPTLFQTSVHPSSIQQVMIDRRRPVREYIPLAGGPHLVGRALVVALLSPADSVVLCGGEEKGTWMADLGVASRRGFAFGLALEREPRPDSLGRVRLEPGSGSKSGETPGLPAFFDLLQGRRPYRGPVTSEWDLELQWS